MVEFGFQLAKTENGIKQLQTAFRLCEPPKMSEQGYDIAYWVSSALSFMTMGSYPYPSPYMLNGMGVLPAYPMRVGCGYMSENFNDNITRLEALREVAGVFYNYSQSLECYDINVNGNNETTLDGELWNYLACQELFMPFGQNGETDMFWYAPYNEKLSIESCQESTGFTPRPMAAETNYGGWRIKDITNIVFSNGELDPWRGAGITRNVSDGISAIIIPDVGHHIDLFFSNANDTQAVKNAREFELSKIKQ